MLPILTYCLSSALAATIPNVTLNTDTIAEAPQVTMPIERVVVYGDRAEVHRIGTHKLTKGINTIRLENIPNTVDANSLRLHLSGVRLLRLESRIVETSTYSLPEVQNLLMKVETLEQQYLKLVSEKQLLTSEIQRLQGIKPKALSESDYSNNVAQYSMNIWKDNWQFFRDQHKELQTSLRQIENEIRITRGELEQLQIESAPILQSPMTQQRREIVAVVESAATKSTTLDLQYTVYGVSWRPIYDVHYDSLTDTARIDTSVMVQQTSGEHWTDVEMELATSTIRQRQELPSMLTWTLGERNEYIPQARPRNGRHQTPLYPPPQAQSSNADIESQRAQQHLAAEQSRLRTTLQALTLNIPTDNRAASSGSAQGMMATKAPAYGLSAPTTSAQTVARADYAYERVEEDMELAPMADSRIYESLAVAETSTMSLRGMAPGMAKKSKELSTNTLQVANMPLALEASNLYRPINTYNSIYALSYEDALNVKWTAPGEFDIPSDGQTHRIPIESHQYQSQSFYEVSPALEEIAYLKAAVQNSDTQTILQGNCNIFLNGHFTTQSMLRTTKPGAMLELPLGADENIRIKRNITPMQRKEGLIKQQDITDYDIKIEIGNYKKTPIQIRLIDQIPITHNEAIVIEPLDASLPYTQEENSQGILYWDVNIPAGQTNTIDLQYAISRPKDWKIWGN